MSSLRFGLLGPVCAWQDGRELDLGPVKQRAVLAVLLLRPNRPVTPNEIVDAVWGDEPPANGANVVQKHVSGLRRALEPERPPRVPGRLLSLTEAGYLLRVEPGQLDADEFRSYLAEARSAREAGQPREALHALHAGLGLWRGTALAGLPNAVFEAERNLLAETHASALEDSLDAELALGRHTHVVPELLRLIAEFPLRERLRYLLMLALARSGRQAEALAAYRDARRFLAEDLGIEPNDELQDLHRQILAAEVSPVAMNAAKGPGGPPYGTAPGMPRKGEPPHGPALPGSSRPSVWQRLGSLWLIILPLLSFGFLAWVTSAYAAIRLGNRRLAFATVGYFAVVLAVGFVGQLPPTPLTNNLIVALLLSAWCVGTAQGFWVRAQLLRPHTRGIDPVMAATLARQVCRQQAYQVLAHHPGLALDLGIGRPDLPRYFDDGGLVDINAVPEQVFASLPGVTPEQARRIIAERRRGGRYASVDDLVARGPLPLAVADSLRNILIALANPGGEQPLELARHHPSA